MAAKNTIALVKLLHRMCAIQLKLDAPNDTTMERVNIPAVDCMIADANNVREQIVKGIAT